MSPGRWPHPAYLVLAAADTALAAAGPRLARGRRVTKPLLMPALMPGSDRRTQVALGLCGAGDVALLGTSDAAFTTGLGCFLAGHVAWIVALHERGGSALLRRRPVAGLPVVAAWAGLNAYLWSRTGRDRIPVAVYSTVIAAMTLVALDTGQARTATGGCLFMVSDTLIALERFGGPALPLADGWVMATYTSAQALLAS